MNVQRFGNYLVTIDRNRRESIRTRSMIFPMAMPYLRPEHVLNARLSVMNDADNPTEWQIIAIERHATFKSGTATKFTVHFGRTKFLEHSPLTEFLKGCYEKALKVRLVR